MADDRPLHIPQHLLRRLEIFRFVYFEYSQESTLKNVLLIAKHNVVAIIMYFIFVQNMETPKRCRSRVCWMLALPHVRSIHTLLPLPLKHYHMVELYLKWFYHMELDCGARTC